MAEDDAFERFVAEHSPALLRSAYALTGDRGYAEDLVQAALMRTYRHWERVISADSPFAYAHRILFTTYHSGRRRRRVREVFGMKADPTVMAPHQELDERDRIERSLQELTPGQRAVIVLRFLEDRTVEETAHLLGCSLGTVKSQTARAIARLRLSTQLHPDEAR